MADVIDGEAAEVTEAQATDGLPIFSNPLSSFEVGAVTDLRFRLACDLIKGELFKGAMAGQPQVDVARVATHALDLAAALIGQSIERGWVKEIPAGNELAARVEQHLKRGVRAQVMTQRWAQELAQSLDPGLAVAQRLMPRQ